MGVGISVLVALKGTTLLLFFAYLRNLGFMLLSAPFLYASLVSFLVSIASNPSINLPMLLGKNPDGTFPISSLIIFSPYLYFVRIFCTLRRLKSGEPPYTEVHDGLYVGGWPSSPEKLPPGDPAIIDCTCEFPRIKGFTGRLPYKCVPTWDTRSPQASDIESAVKWACRRRDLTRPIFVHCAYGKLLFTLLSYLFLIELNQWSFVLDCYIIVYLQPCLFFCCFYAVLYHIMFEQGH